MVLLGAICPPPKKSGRETKADAFTGHINHSLFWKNLAAPSSEGKGNGGALQDGPLKDAITAAFGSLDNLKKEFNAATAGIQGSGWGWLVSAPSCSLL